MIEDLWVIKIVLGLVVVLLLNWGLKKAAGIYHRQAKEKNWPLQIHEIVLTPLRVLLWIFAVFYLLRVLSCQFLGLYGIEVLDRLQSVAVIVILAWFSLRWKAVTVKTWSIRTEQSLIDPNTAQVLGKLLTIVILIIALFFILYILGVNIMPLLAFSGIGAAAIGFSAKDVIANFFGGLMLHITSPFYEGDEILMEKEGIQGVVEEIGWYLTSLRDKEKRSLYLPNALFSTLVVVNCSRISHRRIYEVFSVANIQTEKINGLIEAVKKRLAELTVLDQKIPALVSFDHFGGIGLELSVEAFTSTTNIVEYRVIRQEVFLNILNVLKEEKIAYALPETVIKVDQRELFLNS